MTAPLNYQPPRSATHYAPPDARLPVPRYLLSLALATLCSIAGAAAYASLLPRLRPFTFHIGASLVAAAAVCILSTLASQFGKVRTRTPAALAGLIIPLAAIYTMWLVWIHDRYAPLATYSLLIPHPTLLFQLIRDTNQTGTWVFRGSPVTGLPLLLIWILESATLLAAGLVPLLALGSESPRCRECNRPCTPPGDLPRFSADRESDFVASIDNRTFADLATHTSPPAPRTPQLLLRLYTCPHCLSTHILTLRRLEWPKPTSPSPAPPPSSTNSSSPPKKPSPSAPPAPNSSPLPNPHLRPKQLPIFLDTPPAPTIQSLVRFTFGRPAQGRSLTSE